MQTIRTIVLVFGICLLVFGILTALPEEREAGRSMIVGACILIAGVVIAMGISDRKN